jgi:preprotein translocase subunit YajC
VGPFLIIIVLLGAVWLLFVVPARRRRFAHSAMQDGVAVGDEIITAGGLHGTVREVEDEQVRVEVAPSVVVTLDRRAIAAVATEVEVEVEPEDEPEPAGEPVEEPESEPGAPAEPR